MTTLLDTYLASLPPVSYDPQAQEQRAQAQAVVDVATDVATAAARLLVEVDPSTTQLALPDWERNFGLPDPCAGLASSIERRRADVIAKMLARQNLSALQMEQIAERLGYVGARVVELGPMTCMDPCDGAVFDEDGWRFAWGLRLQQPLHIEHANCMSPCNVPLRSWGNEPILCALARYKPAHTIALAAFFEGET